MLNSSKPTLHKGPTAERSQPLNPPPEFEHFLTQVTASPGEPFSLKDWRDLAEAWRIARALETCRGNRSAAARELGIGRRTLYAKMEKLGLAARWASQEGGQRPCPAGRRL